MVVRHQKKDLPIIGVFLAQPGGALVGPGKSYKTHWDLCRRLKQMGAEGVTIPAGGDYIDLVKASVFSRDGQGYCNQLHAEYEACGTPLLRLEAHIPGNLSNLHPSRMIRFAEMVGDIPTSDPSKLPQFELKGQEAMAMAIKASAQLGLPNLVAFSGGRGWAAAQYPWPAFPENYRQWVLALMVAKHRKNLELAAKLGVKVGFELHPEEDLHSPLLLKFFRDAMHTVSPDAASAIMANGDASHPTLVGDDAAEHMEYLAQENLLSMVHLKDGQLRKCPGGSKWGDFAPKWTESRRRFVTFGTGQADWEKIIPIWLAQHDRLETGLDFIVDAECSQFPDMEQGIGIAIENARRAREGGQFVDKHLIEAKQSPAGNWEDFCTSKLSAAELLCLMPGEKAEIEEIIEQMGDIGK